MSSSSSTSTKQSNRKRPIDEISCDDDDEDLVDTLTSLARKLETDVNQNNNVEQLNKTVCQVYKAKQRVKNAVTIAQFNKGESVWFVDREGRKVYGIIKTCNVKTITVQPDPNQCPGVSTYRLSPTLVHKMDEDSSTIVTTKEMDEMANIVREPPQKRSNAANVAANIAANVAAMANANAVEYASKDVIYRSIVSQLPCMSLEDLLRFNKNLCQMIQGRRAIKNATLISNYKIGDKVFFRLKKNDDRVITGTVIQCNPTTVDIRPDVAGIPKCRVRPSQLNVF